MLRVFIVKTLVRVQLENTSKLRLELRVRHREGRYSHSMVLGGLELIS